MRKNFIISGSIILSFFIWLSGCRKEIQQPKEEINQLNEESIDQSAEKKGHSGGCRVAVFDYYDGVADFHQFDYYSYKKGLVDEWAVWYGGVYKMEYDHNGRLKKARNYDGDVLLYTIHFFYKNDKVVKEIWYSGNTKEVADIVYYTYNRKGQMTKGESINNDYYTTNTYTAKGDLAGWKLHISGSLFATADYTYYSHYRNPLKLTPGVDYSFPYANAAFGTTDRWYSSEKITYYDENGVASVYYDQDPRQTKWQMAFQNYPSYVGYVDKLSRTPLSVAFEFENCGRSNNDHSSHHKANEAGNRNISPLNGKAPSIRSILSGPRSKIRQRMNEMRKQLK